MHLQVCLQRRKNSPDLGIKRPPLNFIWDCQQCTTDYMYVHVQTCDLLQEVKAVRTEYRCLVPGCRWTATRRRRRRQYYKLAVIARRTHRHTADVSISARSHTNSSAPRTQLASFIVQTTSLNCHTVVTTCIVNFSCHDQFGSRLSVCTHYAVYAGTGYSKCLIWWVRPVERVCSHAWDLTRASSKHQLLRQMHWNSRGPVHVGWLRRKFSHPLY